MFDSSLRTNRHNERVNSRNPKTEKRELGKLKNPPIVCAWRNYDKPIPKWRKGLNKWIDRRRRPTQWKVDLHAFALSFLPAVVAVHAVLATSGAIGATLWISMGLYAIMVFMVVFFKGLSKKVIDDKTARNKVGISLIVLVSAAFLPAFTKEFGGSPTNEAWAGLAAAAAIAIISQKWLALDPEYLAEAEKAPHLLSNRDKKLLKIEALTYGFYTVVALPKILPENVKVLVKEVIRTAGEDIPYAISLVGVGAFLLALIYGLFK